MKKTSEAPWRASLGGLLERRRTPLSTYRLQLHPRFGFEAAAGVADYLARLGITDCYTSPILKARPGSTHGYDITDHHSFNPELGGEAGYEGFAAALRARNLGHLLDFAPNHMGADPAANAWWRDVLENGPSSRYAEFFDIDWNPEKAELKNKVLLPILGDQYGAVLERGELRLVFEGGRLALLAPGHPLPIDPQQAPRVLSHGLDRLRRTGDPAATELAAIVAALDRLPTRSDIDPGGPEERRRRGEAARARLEKLASRSPRVARHIRDALSFFNGRADDPGSFDSLHGLLESQAYRLSYWKTAADEINYRRFFDINELAALRMERDEVFDATHGLVLELLASGKTTGLRIDHADGLYDPSRYFERLQGAFLRAWLRRRLGGELTERERGELAAWREGETQKDFRSPSARPLYVAAEKILAPGEPLDPHWCVDGTSGYEFLNEVNRVFTDPRGAGALRRVYESFTGKRASAETVGYASRKAIMATTMASELNVLSGLLSRISETDRRTRDFTRQNLRRALGEIVACFPVYRTYVTGSRTTAYDRDVIDGAVSRARRRNPAMEASIFEFIGSLMLAKREGLRGEEAGPQRLRFAMKVQQYTAPVQAKGVEDTAFYRYNVLISNNEVGADPARLAQTVAQFHEANRSRAEERPRTMLATATHDTKRGEDARARIGFLAEIAEKWEAEALRWSRANRQAKIFLAGEAAPDANDEYFFYQALVGAWDFSQEGNVRARLRERLQAYMLKAGREAKLKTSWLSPNAEYEKATARFVASALSNRGFLDRFVPFARRVAELGALLSLSRTVLKLASPGVADFFQGTELWDLSLVDPDNRRPVDFAARRKKLASLEPLLSGGGRSRPGLKELLDHWEDGRVKLFVTAKALRHRRDHADLFLKGGYEPLEVRGSSAERFIAFRRAFGASEAVVVAPRLLGGHVWRKGLAGAGTLGRNTFVRPPGGAFKGLADIFTGAALPADGDLGRALTVLPFALFASGAE